LSFHIGGCSLHICRNNQVSDKTSKILDKSIERLIETIPDAACQRSVLGNQPNLRR